MNFFHYVSAGLFALLISGCDIVEHQVLLEPKKLILSKKSIIISSEKQATCNNFMRYAKENQADRYLCRDGYVVSYNDSTKQPNWVAYRLTGLSVSHHQRREDQFQVDLSIPKQYRAKLTDYKKSGYDRGHLAPYASVNFSKESATQSFLLSNISPQQAGLNRHGWSTLEKYERFWAKAKQELYIYTGVIYKNKKPGTFIGESKIAVPDYFYKIIYAPITKEVISFVMPNRKVEKKAVAKYRTSIKELEQRTGFYFFSHIPKQDRDKFIIGISPMWKTAYTKEKD